MMTSSLGATNTLLSDARAVLSWEQWNEVESRYGVILLRGALRRAIHRGVIAAYELPTLAMLLSGALTSACLLVVNSEKPDITRDACMVIIERMLSGLRTKIGA
jgi:hypothetical protein